VKIFPDKCGNTKRLGGLFLGNTKARSRLLRIWGKKGRDVGKLG